MSAPGPIRALTWMILGLAFLASCAPGRGTRDQPLVRTEQPPMIETSPKSGDIFEVEAWVNKPSPRPDEQVTIYGSLLKNGVRLGGIMMQARWSERALATGLPDCFVLVIYGSGVCVAAAKDFPPGKFVPVTILFEYEDHVFTGKTGFTPRDNQ